MSKLKRRIQRILAAKQNLITASPGFLGNHAGTVPVPDRPNYVYVRMVGQPLAEVYNTRVPAVPDLPVLVGFDPIEPYLWQVLSERPSSSYGEEDSDLPVVGPHGETHRFMGSGPRGGTDVVWTELRQFMPFRLTASDLSVFVHRGVYFDGTQWREVAPTSASDLTSLVPSTADKALYTLVTLDNSGNLVYTAGSEVNATALALTDIPSPPAGTRHIIGAVRLYEGQDAIEEAANYTDFFDARFPMWHTHSEDDITDIHDPVTLAADADELMGLSGQEINFDTQDANTVLSGPTTGAAADPTFRALVSDDIPNLAASKITSGQLALERGGTEADLGATGPGLVQQRTAGAALSIVLCNFGASADPTVNDDSGDGYDVGSRWVNTTLDKEFICLDATVGAAVWKETTSTGATDGDAIHDNVAGEINAITEKASPVSADLVIIEDSADSNNKKKAQLGNLPGGSGIGTVLLDSTAGAGGTASFSVSGIDSGDRIIEIYIDGRSEAVDDLDVLQISFNSDTTAANYRSQRHYASPTAHVSDGGDTRYFAAIGASNAGSYGMAKIVLVNPAGTTNWKTTNSVCSVRRTSTELAVISYALSWESTSAITSIAITCQSGSDFAEGTRCIITSY